MSIKVLHVTPTYLPAYRYGGPVKIIHQLNKWLVKKGCDVTVYTTNIDGPNNLDIPLSQPISVDGVKVYYFPITYRPWQYSWQLHRSLAQYAGSFDVIHITSVFLSASALGAHYAKKFGKPYIISPHGSFMKDPLRHHSFKKMIYISLFERKNLKNASAVHFVADAERNDYLETKLPVSKVLLIPNGVDEEELGKILDRGRFRKRYNIAEKRKIVLFLGRLNWKKGLDTLIPAFALTAEREPDAILVLAGPDEAGYKKIVKELVDKCGVGEKTIFTGLIMGQDVAAAYLDSDVFVLPAYSEACSISMIEAMYFGLPMVLTKQVGFALAIASAGAALTVEKNVTAVSDAICSLLEDKNLRLEIGGKEKVLVRDKFSIQKMADSFIEAYTWAINLKL